MTWSALWRSLWRGRQSRLCLLVLLAFAAIAIAGHAGLLPDHEANVGGSQDLPSWHWATLLGTDVLGRSVFFRVLAGAQTAVTIGFITTALVIPSARRWAWLRVISAAGWTR